MAIKFDPTISDLVNGYRTMIQRFNFTNYSTDSVINALSNEDIDDITVPKGVHVIDKDVVVPSSKNIIFSRNARFRIVNGAKLTINGSWTAGEDDWIFEIVNGEVCGNFKVSEVRPEWFGARGDGISDDTKAFQDSMAACAKKRRIKLGARTYLIRDTIVSSARGIVGESNYVDSGTGGTLILFDPVEEYDLKPCIRIASAGGVFSDFTLKGKSQYNTRDLSKWVDKPLFNEDKYEMFADGVVGIEVVGGNKPTFRNIITGSLKVGLLLNSTDGHITSYDCTWSGLIGVYCRKNSGDYFFQGGGITGAFSGLMFGIILTAGHYGGIDVNMTRVHMGFSPFGIYQIKDSDAYDKVPAVSGMNANFTTVRFERIGEAAIKLLPKSSSSISANGFGFSWSPIAYEEGGVSGGWISCLPDDLIARDEKQRYAAHIGTVGEGFDVRANDYGGLYKSPNSAGALGSAYIDTLSGNANLVGFDVKDIVIRRKVAPYGVNWSTSHAVGESLRTKTYNALSSGNLMKNPEHLSSWRVDGVGDGRIELASDLKIPPEVSRYIGDSVVGIKFIPDGINSQGLSLQAPKIPTILDEGRDVCYEMFVLSPSGVMRSRLVKTGGYLYDQTYRGNGWTHVVGRGHRSTDIRQVEILNLSATEPSYVVGAMVSYDEVAPYSPTRHISTKSDIESSSGFIVSDEVTGVRYRIKIANGILKTEAI